MPGKHKGLNLILGTAGREDITYIIYMYPIQKRLHDDFTITQYATLKFIPMSPSFIVVSLSSINLTIN